MKLYFFLLLFTVLFVFQNCKKENQIAKKLEGTWNITEYNRAGGYTKTDFSIDKTTLQFFKNKNAYTSTMKGIFKIDYSDPLKSDFIDTFQYQQKGTELDITAVKKFLNGISGTQNKITLLLLRRRFVIKDYKTKNITFIRTDSTDLYIKATKE